MAPRVYESDKWLCSPEKHCRILTELCVNPRTECFEVKVSPPYTDIIFRLVNIDFQSEQAYHWIRFEHVG